MGKSTAMVTGASSGIGLETALLLASSGYAVYGAARRPDGCKAALAGRSGGQGIKVVGVDVNDQPCIDRAVDDMVGAEGRIDALVNCAGYAQMGAIEDLSIGEVRHNMETNFFGTVRMIKSVVPAMRRQGGGRIVNVSAVAGRTGFALGSAYVASKFAVEGLTESLRYELGQFNIRVSAVEPGVVRTGFHANMKVAKGSQESPYRAMTRQLVERSALLYRNGTDAGAVARTILGVLAEEEPAPRYTAGEDAKMLMEERARRTDAEFERYMEEIFGDVMRLEE